MDIAFIMGMIAGFFLGVAWCIFLTDMLGCKLLRMLGHKPPKRKKHDDYDEDDPVNYWKPPGWRPDSL